jgi:putative chitinase
MGSFDFDFTLDQLKQIITGNQYVSEWYDALCQILPDYEINTKLRVAAFLAQCAHESNNFKATVENLNYRPATLRKLFPKYFPTDALAEEYCRKPNKQEAIANRIYANRMSNGAESSGDGFKHRGRGLIQLTGKDNYTRYAESLEISIEEAVEHLTTFEGCVQSAAWFWENNSLNQWADAQDMVTLTKKINGGLFGIEDRIKHYEHALHVLGE